MKLILLTGAAGGVARMLRPLMRADYRLRLSDRAPVADAVAGEEQVTADLADLDTLTSAAEGVDGIVHFGAYSIEGPWETILQSNIVGTYNVFEAARRHQVKRVVFASSNHVGGFYRRDRTIGVDDRVRPDTRYGVSKCFGEALGSLYADKYGLEVLSIRIGSVLPKPVDVRRLAIWVSPRDLYQLLRIGLEHRDIRNEIVYGVSDMPGAGGTIPTRRGSATGRRTAPRTMPKKSWRTLRKGLVTIWRTSPKGAASCAPKAAATRSLEEPDEVMGRQLAGSAIGRQAALTADN